MGRCDDCEAWLTDSGMDLAPCNKAPKSGLFSIVECEKVGESFHVHHEMEKEPAPRPCATVCMVHLPGCDTEDGCIKGCPFALEEKRNPTAGELAELHKDPDLKKLGERLSKQGGA